MLRIISNILDEALMFTRDSVKASQKETSYFSTLQNGLHLHTLEGKHPSSKPLKTTRFPRKRILNRILNYESNRLSNCTHREGVMAGHRIAFNFFMTGGGTGGREEGKRAGDNSRERREKNSSVHASPGLLQRDAREI